MGPFVAKQANQSARQRTSVLKLSAILAGSAKTLLKKYFLAPLVGFTALYTAFLTDCVRLN